MPFLTYPLALLAAAALPALAAIYILRNRYRRREVSSLMLWQFAVLSREGITSTAGALGLVLARHAVTAAPVGMAANAARLALSSAAAGTGATWTLAGLSVA